MAVVTRRRFQICATVTVTLGIVWALLGLTFRLTGAYASMPVAPGEPHGIADVLEFLHGVALLVVAGFAALQGVLFAALGRLRLRPFALPMLLFALALPAVYGVTFNWAASLSAQ